MASFTSPPDEGFSEYPMETQSTSDSTVAVRDLPSYVTQMSVQDRAQLAVLILNGLPAEDFSRVFEAIKPRLYINFFHHLPSEICLKIFGFLDPRSLIRSAQASQEWMALALNPHLWQALYYQEGFLAIASEIQKFELEQAGSAVARRPRSLGSTDGHASKKRSIRDHHFELSSGETGTFASGKGKRPQKCPHEDEDMLDADQVVQEQSLFGGSGNITRTFPAQREERCSSTDSERTTGSGLVRGPRNSQRSHASSGTSTPLSSAELASYPELLQSPSKASRGSRLIKPALYLRDPDTGRLRLNWHHLFTVRRRLEANWEAGKYVNFQLPHPDHPEEAHGECVYTIQYSGKYLVSGSRDHTVRIWNLDTRRLVRAPLVGHKGSVLCLQFDADPDEDIIVSGSSDSDVIIWKFSTGEIAQRLHHAHRESVLNVRFDKKILVTCSKDNTIKIFNRRPIRSDDPDYPRDKEFDCVPKVLNNYGFNPAPSAGITIKPAYTLIGCLDGHHAAVNAVQIYNNEIVSASGDRTVKVWDWTTGSCTRTLVGHNKGIACVQYDGRRIVSGSSDNEVKVFDSATTAEVASLRGHTNLVRTVQAGFGDLPYSKEQDQQDAKATDEEFFKAVESGALPDSPSKARRKMKNAGSRKPEDITAYGAKIPPGGGGGKYGRIVSGSYDETVIIWRRDKNGVWKPQHTLRQADAARAAAKLARPRLMPTVARLTQDALDAFDMPSTRPPLGDATNRGSTSAAESSDPMSQNQAGPSSQTPIYSTSNLPSDHSNTLPIASPYVNYFQTLLQTAVATGPDTLRTILDTHPILHLLPTLPTLITSLPSDGLRSEMRAIVSSSRITNAREIASVHALLSRKDADSAVHLHNLALAVAQATVALQIQRQQAARERLASSVAANARVFKLQFCARRIVCCSQMRVIVGWDFGAGDREVVEAGRFFGTVE